MDRKPTIVITGAAGGIGSAIAEQFAATYKKGNLLFVDHPSMAYTFSGIQAFSDSTKEYINLVDLHVTTTFFDITDYQSARLAMDGVVAQHGRIDVLVNAAGIMPKDAMKTLAKVDEKDLLAMRRVMDVNFWGTLHCCRAVLPHMREAGYGRIVNIASVVGLKGDAGNLAYAASKAAVISLTKTLACEAPFNKNRGEPALDITVNAVAPGIVETPMTKDLSEAALAPYLARNPQRRKILPGEIAEAVLWLASKEASAVNGICLPVDGGYLVSS